MVRPNTLEGCAMLLIDRGARLNDAALDSVATLSPTVGFSWNGRLKAALGYARQRMVWDFSGRPERVKRLSIDLNPILLEESTDVLRQTFLHELAHVVAGIEAKHGWVWQRQMRTFDARPDRCWNAEDAPKAAALRKVARVKHVATCVKCCFALMKARALNTSRGQVYTHKGCGGVFLAPAAAHAIMHKPELLAALLAKVR